MDYFYNNKGVGIVLGLIKTIQDNKDYLSEIDGALGDGDHGINMNKGFTLCKERLTADVTDFSKALKTLGRVLLMEIGGSMGPLYGTFFIEMSKKCADKETIDKNTFKEMIEAALNGISTLGKAKVGDKTLIDTLVPAVEAYNKALAEGKDFSGALIEMKAAAEKGKDSTKDMVAKIGRASRLGERSRGVLDAGSISCYLIIASISDSIKALLES
ncbi:MAG: dihydroxyacetone kinase subunit DhaL [Bacillota bacterium]|nr:dihydroxyacetone kinase subunit DhaL [Bacillota bacterium]